VDPGAAYRFRAELHVAKFPVGADRAERLAQLISGTAYVITAITIDQRPTL
jgi:hypothetical protein